LQQQNSIDKNQLSIKQIASRLHEDIIAQSHQGIDALIHQSMIDLIYSNYINLVQDIDVSLAVKTEVYGIILKQVKFLEKKNKRKKIASGYADFYTYQLQRLKSVQLQNLKPNELIQLPKMPPGSPI